MATYELNTLYDAYKASMKGSAWKEEPQRFEIDFLSELVKLQAELEDRSYKTLKGSEFIINERGKIRYIHGARMRDRVVRHALCDTVISPTLNKYLIYNNGASQTGKGISFSRMMFERDLHSYYLEYKTNEGWVGFVDISKFYDNIPHEKIKELILPHLDEFNGWLLSEIVDTFKVDVSYMTDEEYERCLSEKFDSVAYSSEIPPSLRTGEKYMAKSVDIGDQLSQNIGIYYPTRLDNYAKIVCGVKRYGRYMDDIYIILPTKAEVEAVIEGIKREAESLGLFLNERKTRIVKLSSTYKYLQIKYSLTETGKIIRRINPKSVTRERRKLKAYKRRLKAGALPYESIEQSYKSWMGSYAPLMSKRQRKNMQELYYTLFERRPRWKKTPTKSHSQTERSSPTSA